MKATNHGCGKEFTIFEKLMEGGSEIISGTSGSKIL
jgi:hypothetical protein